MTKSPGRALKKVGGASSALGGAKPEAWSTDISTGVLVPVLVRPTPFWGTKQKKLIHNTKLADKR